MTSIFTTISEYQTRLDAREAAALTHLVELWERIEADIVADLERLIARPVEAPQSSNTGG